MGPDNGSRILGRSLTREECAELASEQFTDAQGGVDRVILTYGALEEGM